MANTAKIPIVLKVAQIYQDSFAGVPASTVVETYDNPGHPLNGFPYVWDVLVEVTPTPHSDSSTQTANFYNALDIAPGMWLADNSHRSYKIIELIDSAADGAANYKRIRIKDVGMYTALSEPVPGNGANDNTPVYAGGNFAYIFTLSEDGLPNFGIKWIGPPADISFINNITSRFQYRNLLTANYNNSDSPNPAYASYQVGQMVYLDNTGTFQVLDASDATQVKKRFGVITSVNVPEDGDLGVRPWGKVVGDLDLSSFTVGDALYYDDLDPTNDVSYLTAIEPASSAIPMYIKISDTTGMYITDMVGGGGDQIYISQVADGTPTPEDVGGIDQGTLPENIGDGTYTLSEVIDQLLWPAICPTVNGPQVTLSDNASDLQIIGDSLNIAFTTGASGGSISGGQGVAAGDLTSATLAGAGSTNETLSITPPYDIADYTLNGYTVVSGSQSWTLTGTFAAGQMPVDNLGGNCPDVQYNGGTDTASVNFEGVYPVYAGNSTQYQGAASGTWTTASVNTTYWTQLSLFSFNSAYFQWNQTYNEDAVAPDVVRHRFAIPSVLTVNDIKKYNSVSGNYDSIPLSQFSTTATTLDVFGNSVAYTIYEKSNSAGGASQYRVYFTD